MVHPKHDLTIKRLLLLQLAMYLLFEKARIFTNLSAIKELHTSARTGTWKRKDRQNILEHQSNIIFQSKSSFITSHANPKSSVIFASPSNPVCYIADHHYLLSTHKTITSLFYCHTHMPMYSTKHISHSHAYILYQAHITLTCTLPCTHHTHTPMYPIKHTSHSHAHLLCQAHITLTHPRTLPSTDTINSQLLSLFSQNVLNFVFPPPNKDMQQWNL